MTIERRLTELAAPSISGTGIDITIVVIAYNEAAHISDCLDALLCQVTEQALEVVVVDDGSTDGTDGIVNRRRVHDDRLRLVRLDANSGRGVARMAGLASARGINVGFVDADIVVPENWIQRLADELPGAAAISGIAVPDGDVAALARISGATPRVVPGSATITGNNVIFDGAVLRATPFPESRLGEDFRLAELLRSRGHALRSSPDVIVQHDERKTYRASLRWLFESGVDATCLLVEFARIRLPDVVAIGWWITCVSSLTLAFLVTPWLCLVPLIATVVAAFVHVATRFSLRPSPLRWLAAAVADVPLMGAYLIGRAVGLTRLRRLHRRGPPAGGQIEEPRRDALARGSFNLVVNNLTATGLGFLSWMVTTRLWPATDVGIAAATISAAFLAANLAMLGVQGTLLRAIPASANPRALLATGLVVTIPVAVVLGVGFGLLQGTSLGSGNGWLLGFAVFVALVVSLVVKAMLEAAVIAVRASASVVRATAAANGVKIAALAGLGALPTGALGIVAGSLAASASNCAALLRSAHRREILAGPREFSRALVRSLHRYSLTFYINSLIGGIPVLVLPILVRSQLGDDEAAYWYIASLMAAALFLVPAAVGTALLVEGSDRRGELRGLVVRAAGGLAVVMVPVICIAILVSPAVLRMFGSDYAEHSTTPFRILALSGVLVSASYVLGDVMLVRRRLLPLTILNVVNALVVIGLAWRATNLDAVAWAWFAGEVANIVMFVIIIPLFHERASIPEMTRP